MKAHLVDLQFAAYGHPMADVAMLFASSAELGAVVPDRSAAQRRLLAGYAAELEHCFRLQGDAPPAGTSVEALHVLLGPELASSGLALTCGGQLRCVVGYGQKPRCARKARRALGRGVRRCCTLHRCCSLT